MFIEIANKILSFLYEIVIDFFFTKLKKEQVNLDKSTFIEISKIILVVY